MDARATPSTSLTKKNKKKLLALAESGTADAFRSKVAALGLGKATLMDVADGEGCSLVHRACRNSDIGVLRYLADDMGLSLVQCNKVYKTPLHEACNAGLSEHVKFLLRSKAAVDIAKGNGWRPLMYAAKSGNITIVNALLNHNADIEARNKEQSTALTLATRAGQSGVVAHLLEAKANVDTRTHTLRTPLLAAAAAGHSACVRALLAGKADIRAVDSMGNSVVHECANHGHLDILELIVEVENMASRRRAVNAESVGARNAAEGGGAAWLADMVQVQDAVGQLPLHAAAVNGNGQLLDRLLPLTVQAGLINSVDSTGCTSLHLAAVQGHGHCVAKLIESRADMEMRTSPPGSRTALHCAAGWGKLSSARTLVQSKADVGARDGEGHTPLEVAHLGREHGRKGARGWTNAEVNDLPLIITLLEVAAESIGPVPPPIE